MSSSSYLPWAVMATVSVIGYYVSIEDFHETIEKDHDASEAVRQIYQHEDVDDEQILFNLTMLLASEHVRFVRSNRLQVMRESNLGDFFPPVIARLSDALRNTIHGADGGETKRHLALLLLADCAEYAEASTTKADCVNILNSIEKAKLQRMTRELLHFVSHYSIQMERFLFCVQFLLDKSSPSNLSNEMDAWKRILEHGLSNNKASVINLTLGMMEASSCSWSTFTSQLERIVERSLTSSEHFDYHTTYAAFFPINEEPENDKREVMAATDHDIWLECGQNASKYLETVHLDKIVEKPNQA
jgi:hypothetical protein